MPIERRSDLDNQVIHTSMRGVITLGDLLDHFKAVRAMDGHEWRELVDARDVRKLAVNASEMPGLAAEAREIFAGRRMAPRAVVVQGLHYYSLGQVFALAASRWVQIRMFQSRRVADEWLDQMA